MNLKKWMLTIVNNFCTFFRITASTESLSIFFGQLSALCYWYNVIHSWPKTFAKFFATCQAGIILAFQYFDPFSLSKGITQRFYTSLAPLNVESNKNFTLGGFIPSLISTLLNLFIIPIATFVLLIRSIFIGMIIKARLFYTTGFTLSMKSVRGTWIGIKIRWFKPIFTSVAIIQSFSPIFLFFITFLRVFQPATFTVGKQSIGASFVLAKFANWLNFLALDTKFFHKKYLWRYLLVLSRTKQASKVFDLIIPKYNLLSNCLVRDIHIIP